MSNPAYFLLQNQEGQTVTCAGKTHLKALPLNLLDRNQHWTIKEVGADAGSFIVSKNGNFVFDVQQGLAKENQSILAWTKNGEKNNNNQRFSVNLSESTEGEIRPLLNTKFVISIKDQAVVLSTAQSPLGPAQTFSFVPAPHEYTIKVVNNTDSKVSAQFTNAPDSEANPSFSVDPSANHSSVFLQGSTLEFKDANGAVLRTVKVSQDDTITFDKAPPPAPVDLGEPGQFVLYNSVVGAARVVGFSQEGKLTVQKVNANWWKTFTLLATADFRGVNQTDLVLYAAPSAGNGCIVDFAVDGTGTVLSSFSGGKGNWWLTWKYMIPGNFRGRGAADAFLHETQHSPTGIACIVSWSDKGVYNFVNSGVNFGVFNLFVEGHFLGNALDQLIAYNTTTGAGFLVGFGADGLVHLKEALPAWAQKATHIVAGSFRGKQGKTDLILYDRTTHCSCVGLWCRRKIGSTR